MNGAMLKAVNFQHPSRYAIRSMSLRCVQAASLTHNLHHNKGLPPALEKAKPCDIHPSDDVTVYFALKTRCNIHPPDICHKLSMSTFSTAIHATVPSSSTKVEIT